MRIERHEISKNLTITLHHESEDEETMLYEILRRAAETSEGFDNQQEFASKMIAALYVTG